jgi:phosphatidylinositol-3-phosphatase
MHLPRRRRTLIYLGAPLALVIALVAALSSLGDSPPARAKACLPYRVRQAALAAFPRAPASARVPSFSHVVVIMMENKECSQVVGSPQAPYLNRLGGQYATLLDLYGTRHPSFPNYIALTAGSTLGATRDCSTCRYTQTNLVDQLEAAHISWKAYAEGMPSPCYRASNAGNYASRHNPLLFYTDIRHNARRCANVVPLSQLSRDLRAGTLPRFAWITPNLCDDMHNCGVRSGDAFLARTVPPLLEAVGPLGAIFITWDEGTTNRNCCNGRGKAGNIPTFVAGGAVRPHSAPTAVYDSYSILRTIEDAWRLPHMREAGCRCTHTIGGIWSTAALAGHP